MTMAEKAMDLKAKQADHHADLQGKLVEAGFPPDFSAQGMNDMNQQQFQQIMAAFAAIQQSQQAGMAQLGQAIIQAVTAPKVIVKDPNGRPIGVKTALQ